MSRSLLFLPLLLTACTGEDKPADDTGSDTNTPSCTVEIDSTLPSQGALDADYRAAVEFNLSEADPTASVSSSIAGTTSVMDDGEKIVFTPNEPLAPSTPYTVTLTYCGGTADLSFTTSSLGTPISDVSILVDRTYGLDLANARILEPAGVGTVLTGYLTQDILVGVVSVDASKIQMIGAIGKEDVSPPEQDYCTQSIAFPEANFTEQPYFQIGPQNTTLSVAGMAIEIGNLEITGTFASDGSYISGATLAGTIDTRPLDGLLSDTGEEGAICELAVSFGAACEACPADGEPFCLSLVADQIEALQVEGETLVAVAMGDCDGCADGPPAEGATCPDPGAE